jgi:carboxyl-terminal processing protease
MTKFDFPAGLCKVFAAHMMKYFSKAVLTALFFAALPLPRPALAATSPDPGQVALAVARWLEQAHYTRKKLDDEMSAKLLTTYLEALDYNKLYFTQQDVDEFTKKFATGLDDAIFRGDLSPAHEIFARFKERVEARVASNKKLAAKKPGGSSSDYVQLNRQKAPWPKNLAEADKLWSQRVEAELLQENLNEFKPRPPEQTVIKRYDQALRNVREMEPSDVVNTFLSALAQSYDPHSEYLSPSEMENFNISMKLSLVGVGAVLRNDDGFARVMEVVPGGPADRDGRLKENDRIAAVAQGDGEFEDVVDMKLDKVVERIRGKKGTVVRLQVVPGDATDPSKRHIVEITRDKVELKDQEAKAEVIDVQGPNQKTTRIGWITLPAFYANMSGEGAAKSATEDVSALLGRLKQEGIEGLVFDLRKDGGGSLEEAINLTGLFIPKGPVVQVKDSNGKISVSSDTNPAIAYTGPMVVVTNRLSASASEIFAAALQDYGRAVIVGDERSFGKGTVQTVLDIGKVMPFFSLGSADAGALKLTINKFYRVRGGSTQLNGVASDIVLPSRTDNAEIGEGSLKNRLEYDEVAPQKITEWPSPLFLEELRASSKARVASDPEFAYVSQDMKRLRERIAENRLSLNEKVRRQELAQDKARKEERQKERVQRGPLINAEVWQLTLDDIRSKREKLEPVAYERDREKHYAEDPEEAAAEKKDGPKPAEPDPIRNETLRVIEDLINLTKQNQTASANGKSAGGNGN